MSKMNCNIIKDLLPSYLDEICSPESRDLLEEHFNECENCKKLYERIKLEMLHNNSTSVVEVDYFKKIKTNVSHKNTVLMVVVGLLFIAELYYNLNFGYSNYLNYFFPLLLGGLLFVILPDYAENKISTPFMLKVLGAELAGIATIFLLLLYTGYSTLNDIPPFGTKPENIGPFLATVTLTILVGFILAFVATLFLSIKKKTICPSLIFVPLGGIAFAFECIHFLHEFDTRFTLMLIADPLILFVAQVILLIFVYKIINQKKYV